MITYWRNGKGIEPCPQWEPECWVHVENPTQEERDYLMGELEIPEAFYNDVEDVDERPRIEFEDNWFFIILRLPYHNPADERVPYSAVPLGIMFKDDVFATVCFHQVPVASDFIQHSVRKGINYADYFDLVLRLMLSSSVWFLKYLKRINVSISVAERELEQSVKNRDLQSLLRIEKSLVYFTTSLRGNDMLLHRIKNLRNYKNTYDEDLVEDVEIELRQAMETTNVYSDILSSLTETYGSIISNNLSAVMKQLTIISLILMLPTLVASLFGMNVPNGMESNPYGFFIILLISLVCSLVAIIYFVKKRWF
ncbi:MAG: magnesium transporter CorA family protein [Bacteroidales bacterium]|nr:magnesium transporter CorA family protein [Bacteroidales bacterium]